MTKIKDEYAIITGWATSHLVAAAAITGAVCFLLGLWIG